MNTVNIKDVDLNNSFFHFSRKENLESIEKEGIKAAIGDASIVNEEREPRVYLSKGGKGIIEIKSTFIRKFKGLRICDIPEEYRAYFRISDFSSTDQVSENAVYDAMEKRFKDEVYFLVDAVEEEDYTIEDQGPKEFKEQLRASNNIRDFKGKVGHDIDSSKLSLITTDNGSTSFDIVKYLYNRLIENAKKRGTEDIVRANLCDLDAFFKFVRDRENEEPEL